MNPFVLLLAPSGPGPGGRWIVPIVRAPPSTRRRPTT